MWTPSQLFFVVTITKEIPFLVGSVPDTEFRLNPESVVPSYNRIIIIVVLTVLWLVHHLNLTTMDTNKFGYVVLPHPHTPTSFRNIGKYHSVSLISKAHLQQTSSAVKICLWVTNGQYPSYSLVDSFV
jgi:hypothetical protein